MAISSFLDKYFECVDSLPQDLQRYVTQLREVELEKRDLFLETERLRDELVKAVENGSKKQLLIFRKLQESLLEIREIGNFKLELSAQMVDTVEEYTQQLRLCAKEVESHPRGGEGLIHTPHYSSVAQFSAHRGESSPMSNGLSDSKLATKRTSSSKRPRQPATTGDKGHEEDISLFTNGGMGGREGVASRVKESGLSTVVVSGATGTSGNNGKPPKKKIKTVKKKISVTKEKETPPSGPPSAHVPMPDLTSQPLDPNEPTYCLCQQVSFGEMIGCDNDDCHIEWFHFQCVGLTSKPKGKWYCPKCTLERKAKSGR